MFTWTPQYLNIKVSNKSKQSIDVDYWNALWNAVIAQADNNTLCLAHIFETYDNCLEILEDYGEYKSLAERVSVGQLNGVNVLPTDEYWHNNAKYYADMAEVAASRSGYFEMSISDDGYLMWTGINTGTIDFYLDEDGCLILTNE